jgi:hypothetical protein
MTKPNQNFSSTSGKKLGFFSFVENSTLMRGVGGGRLLGGGLLETTRDFRSRGGRAGREWG